MKKTAVALMLGTFAITTAVPVLYELPVSSVAMAAKGGARISAPKAAPKAAPKTTAPATEKAPSNGYAPSKDAKSLPNNAPAANSKANAAAAATKSSTPWGGMMRNIGLLAGGMFLGSMLSSLFGMGGTGMMSEVFGLLMNIVLFGAVFMVLRMLWNKFRSSRREENNPYQNSYQAQAGRNRPIDITPPKQRPMDIAPQQAEQPRMMDINPANDGYDPKRTADQYRSK